MNEFVLKPWRRDVANLVGFAMAGLTPLLLGSQTGCASKPSPAFVQQLGNHSETTPGFTLDMTKPMVERFGNSGEVLPLAEILGNKLGFRIEVDRGMRSRLPESRFVFQAFQSPSLAGLVFHQDGSAVQILAECKEETVVESVLPPKEGFEAIFRSVTSAAEKNSAIETVKAWGISNAESVVNASLEADGERSGKRVASLVEAVKLACKDNNYKRAWVVSYRVRSKCSAPSDSPFWELCDAYLKANGIDSIMPNAELIRLDAQGWVHSRGQQDLKASLTIHYLVAFEDSRGKLAKTEQLKAFL